MLCQGISSAYDLAHALILISRQSSKPKLRLLKTVEYIMFSAQMLETQKYEIPR